MLAFQEIYVFLLSTSMRNNERNVYQKRWETNNHNFTQAMINLETLRQWHHEAVEWQKNVIFHDSVFHSNLFIISAWISDNYQYCHNILSQSQNHWPLPCQHFEVLNKHHAILFRAGCLLSVCLADSLRHELRGCFCIPHDT